LPFVNDKGDAHAAGAAVAMMVAATVASTRRLARRHER